MPEQPTESFAVQPVSGELLFGSTYVTVHATNLQLSNIGFYNNSNSSNITDQRFVYIKSILDLYGPDAIERCTSNDHLLSTTNNASTAIATTSTPTPTTIFNESNTKISTDNTIQGRYDGIALQCIKCNQFIGVACVPSHSDCSDVWCLDRSNGSKKKQRTVEESERNSNMSFREKDKEITSSTAVPSIDSRNIDNSCNSSYNAEVLQSYSYIRLLSNRIRLSRVRVRVPDHSVTNNKTFENGLTDNSSSNHMYALTCEQAVTRVMSHFHENFNISKFLLYPSHQSNTSIGFSGGCLFIRLLSPAYSVCVPPPSSSNTKERDSTVTLSSLQNALRVSFQEFDCESLQSFKSRITLAAWTSIVGIPLLYEQSSPCHDNTTEAYTTDEYNDIKEILFSNSKLLSPLCRQSNLTCEHSSFLIC